MYSRAFFTARLTLDWFRITKLLNGGLLGLKKSLVMLAAYSLVGIYVGSHISASRRHMARLAVSVSCMLVVTLAIMLVIIIRLTLIKMHGNT